jgi:hypothetical protein
LILKYFIIFMNMYSILIEQLVSFIIKQFNNFGGKKM